MIITDASSLVGIMKREEYVNYKTTANLLIINKGRKISFHRILGIFPGNHHAAVCFG